MYKMYKMYECTFIMTHIGIKMDVSRKFCEMLVMIAMDAIDAMCVDNDYE